ncbi:MAG TPA: hypothetical protein VE011_07060 [Candidatus Dormibacteraeota bacterium]|nr:hypothetical protein [Candidatus Dormibacteraeota bacterium]
MPDLHEVPLASPAWSRTAVEVQPTEFAGRRAVAFGDAVDLLAMVADVELTDGVVEIDMAVTGERAFHGVVWRVRDRQNYESFYVRPHQVGNPDSIQYNPVFNDVAAWQLYHDEGFWAAVDFPIGAWFTVRVVFAGTRAEVFVGDLQTPALVVAELKMPVAIGGIGILIGGPGLFVSRLAYSAAAFPFVADPAHVPPPVPGIVPAWLVSDPFAEPEPAPMRIEPASLGPRRWIRLPAEASGLVNLAIASGIVDGRNTVFARTTITSDASRIVALALGFSDRAVMYLNGVALFRGDDTYRSRDYRFLGSIGWYDTIYLPLVEGANDLVIAVSESFGGWGIQARFDELAGLSIST